MRHSSGPGCARSEAQPHVIFVASDLDPSRENQHVPGPSLWPVGLAVGVVVLLVGFVVSATVVVIGGLITLVFAFLWVRDLTRGAKLHEDDTKVKPEKRPPRAPAAAKRPGREVAHAERYPRNEFLEVTTLGLGAVIGALVTLPVIGFVVGDAFRRNHPPPQDLGPISAYPEGKFLITTFISNPDAGFVSRRTAFIRNNGFLGKEPSFTFISNHCAHLGCPVQPNAQVNLKLATQYRKTVTWIPVNPSGFGCPCHGGQYDTEGNRTAGPPVRALDRYTFSIVNGHLFVGQPFSVWKVEGTGREREDPGADSGVPRRARQRDRVLALPDPASTLMATKSKTTQERILYPLDWLEERSGLVGGVKYFLFRNVPADVNWFQTLGSATLTAFLVQATTGVVLAMYYEPGTTTAYASIQHITNDVWAGWLVRGMHKWGASVFIILMFLHMGRVFLFGAYKYPRELNWIIGVLLLASGLAEGFTGYLLPWDQTSYWATTVGINLNGTAPFLGPFIAQFLQGGTFIGSDTISRFYAIHMLILPATIGGLIVLHMYLVIRLGVTSPPWSKEAAGKRPAA